MSFNLTPINCPTCNGKKLVGDRIASGLGVDAERECPDCYGFGCVIRYYHERRLFKKDMLEELRKCHVEEVTAKQDEFDKKFPPAHPVRIIQLKWSDESEWKSFAPLIVGVPEHIQLLECREDWEQSKAKYALNHDAEFRVHELAH